MEKQFICSWLGPTYTQACTSVSFLFFTHGMGYDPDEIKKVENLKVWQGCQIGECHYILRIQ